MDTLWKILEFIKIVKYLKDKKFVNSYSFQYDYIFSDLYKGLKILLYDFFDIFSEPGIYQRGKIVQSLKIREMELHSFMYELILLIYPNHFSIRTKAQHSPQFNKRRKIFKNSKIRKLGLHSFMYECIFSDFYKVSKALFF